MLLAAIQSNADVLTIITARLQDNKQQRRERTFARFGERNPTIFDARLRWDLVVKNLVIWQSSKVICKECQQSLLIYCWAIFDKGLK